MKTIEEKAKRYDEAIERAKKVLLDCTSEEQKVVEFIFPELKESEDERIRKEISTYLKSVVANKGYGDSIIESWIAWLEKQGEQKYIPKYKIGDYVKNTNYKGDPIYEIVYIDKECYICEYRGKERVGDKAVMHFSFDNPYLRLVQNPADKIEPKFHKDDWIIHRGTENIYQVVAIIDNQYQLKYGNNYTTQYCEDVDRCARLWDITKDAKDGDVLHSTGFHSDCVFIFNGLDNWKFDEPNSDKAVATGYCGLFVSADKMEFGIQGPDCVEVNTVKPATKIQRDLLFQKMKEAGYEWDAKNKELKRIEQIWSEEDERIYQSIMSDTVQENQLNDKQTNWLRDIKYRYFPQPKQEWSEEDYNEIETIACHLDNTDNEDMAEVLRNIRDKYCHTIPQNTWKPSEEQMEHLSRAVNGGSYRTSLLMELYQDLKKL